MNAIDLRALQTVNTELRSSLDSMFSAHMRLTAERDSLLSLNRELAEALEAIVRAEWTAVSLKYMTPQQRKRLEAARAVLARAQEVQS